MRKKHLPQISIIIPTRNRENHILKALSSVQNQSYRNFECIIVDDGSTDNTQHKVLNFINKDQRFNYIKQEALGSAAARNKGIEFSKGKYLAFLDSDDEYLPDGLEKLYNAIVENSNIKLVYANYMVYEENTGIYREYLTFKSPIKPELYQCFIVPRDNPILPSATIVEKEAFDKVGKLNEFFITSQMVEFWGRFVEYFDIVYLNDFTTIYHRHDGQITNNLKKRRFFYDEVAYNAIKRLTIYNIFDYKDIKDLENLVDSFVLKLYKNPFCPLKSCLHLLETIQKVSYCEKRERKLNFINKNFEKIIESKFQNQ